MKDPIAYHVTTVTIGSTFVGPSIMFLNYRSDISSNVMDILDDVEVMDDYLVFRDNNHRFRRDFYQELSDVQFIQNFRFDKPGIQRLVELLDDQLGREFSNGLDHDGQVCLALGLLGGNYFQRVGGLIGGVDQSTQQRVLMKVVRAINTLKDHFIYMPTEAMLQSNEQENLRKYKLPGFGYAVDGVHMIFEEKPRKIPDGVAPRLFFYRKSR